MLKLSDLIKQGKMPEKETTQGNEAFEFQDYSEVKASEKVVHTASVFNFGISRILLVFTIIITMALFVVWERNKTIELGYQVAKLQRNCAELSEKNRKLNYYVNRLKSPEVIAFKIRSLKLPLIQQEETSYMTAMGRQSQLKENLTKPIKTGLNKDLYTQKEPILNCCSLHN